MKKLYSILLTTLFIVGLGATATATTVSITTNTNWSALTIGSGDDVIVGNGATLTVNVTNAVCASLTLGSGSTSGALTFVNTGTQSLTVNGIITVGSGTAGGTGTIHLLSVGKLTCDGLSLSSTSTASVYGDGGTLTINGTISVGSGGTYVWEPTNGTVIIAAAITLPSSVFTRFYNLIINPGSGNTVTTVANMTMNNNLTISSGTLANPSLPIHGNTSGTFTMAAGTNLTLGDPASSTDVQFPSSFTTAHIALDPTSTVTFQANGAQSVSAVPVYGNLVFSTGTSSSTKTISGATTVAGTLTISANTTFDVSSSNWGLNVGGNYTNNGTFTQESGTVTMNGTADQTIGGSTATTFNNLTISNTAASVSAGASLTVSGTLTVNSSATLDMMTYALSVGTPSNSGTINTQCILDPVMSTGKTWGGTINYNGSSAQTIPSGTYSTLKVNNTVRAMLGGASTITTLIIGDVTANSIFYDGGYGITTATTLTITSGTYHCGNATFPWGNSSIGGTVIYYNYILQTIANKTYSNLKITGGLNGFPPITKTLATGSTTTVTGSFWIDYYTTLAFGTTSQTLALTGTGAYTFQNNGTLDMSTGPNAAHVLQLAASSLHYNFGTVITGTGSKVEYTALTGGQVINTGLTYNNLQLDNTSGTNTLDGNLTVNGTLTTTAGGFLNMGTNLLSVTDVSNAGTIRTQNTTSLPISTGKTWGGTVQYDASTGQTVVAGTYNNLNTGNSAGVSLGGGVTVSGNLTLTSGNITTGAYTLTLGGSGATLSEAAGHYVVGNLQSTQAVGNGASSTFGGIGVTLGAAAENLGNVTVTRISGSHVTLNSNTGINRIWKINPANALTVARDLTISWIADDDNSKVLTSVQAWKSTDDFASVDNTSTIGSTTDASSSRSVTASLPSLTGAATTSFTVSQSNQPLPVELTSFNSSVNGKAVNLNWKTATEINNYGFEVERIRNEELGIRNWEKVGFVTGAGNSNSPKEYSFTDKSVTSGKYLYRLKQLDNDGQYTYSKEVEADLGTPTAFSLEQNYPNPFNPSTVIRYALPFESNVKLIVYNFIGEVVKELVGETVSAGYQEVSFDAGKLSSGIYFYTLHAASLDGKQNYQSVRKMLLLK